VGSHGKGNVTLEGGIKPASRVGAPDMSSLIDHKSISIGQFCGIFHI
jgi:hypothetical protein